MSCSEYDALEPNAPSYAKRFKTLGKMAAAAKRVVVRIQPYIEHFHEEILSNLCRYKNEGVYGVVVEGMKVLKSIPGFVRLGGDFCYPRKVLERRFREIKAVCHDNGLAFLCGENRLRSMGDSLTCCGCEGVEGFVVNKANMNQYLFDKESYVFTPKMKEPGTAYPAKALFQHTVSEKQLRMNTSYYEFMKLVEKDKGFIQTFLSKE
ncbi:MAG: hypothetical protein JXA50_01730 [Deltaproteobacteria bacterium]|nr:hypothetical protein [Deltaproteobacteria bacterium]